VSRQARAAIRRLRTGVVPTWQFGSLSVGYEPVREIIRRSLTDLDGSCCAAPLFVRGEWGTGKSHFLSFARASAAREGFVCARVDLNARSFALSHPQRFLPALTDDMSCLGHEGVRSVIYGALDDASKRQQLQDCALNGATGDLRWPLLELYARYEAGERIELGNHSAWRIIQGADLCWSDHGSKREKALQRLQSLAILCRSIGWKGLVLLFDEAETVDQLWNVRSRLSAYSVLDRLCGMRSMWCIFGVTDRFQRTVEGDLSYAAAHNLLESRSGQFLRHWRAGNFRIAEPPKVDGNGARRLARAVASLYGTAYEQSQNSEGIIDRCLAEWKRNPMRNPRRLVRLLIHALDNSRALDV
jgi:bacteriophage exclusion system BrxC/D-like protein